MIEVKANSNFIFKAVLGTPEFIFIDHDTHWVWNKKTANEISMPNHYYEAWTDPSKTHLVTIFWWEK